MNSALEKLCSPKALPAISVRVAFFDACDSRFIEIYLQNRETLTLKACKKKVVSRKGKFHLRKRKKK